MAIVTVRKEVRSLGKGGEIVILRVRNEVRLLRTRWEMAMRVRKEVRLLGKTGEIGTVSVCKDVRLLGKSREMATVRAR